jgi:hypothetical protein
MIYSRPPETEPLAQGDILHPLPLATIDVIRSPVLTAEGDIDGRPWLTIDSTQSVVESSVKRTWGIIGTQECDVLHSPLLSFFEIMPLANLTRFELPTTPRGWVGIITKELRRIPRVFYLPTDPALGFSERMGVDFGSVFQVPVDSVSANLSQLTRARLHPIALDHFRHSIAAYYTRYAYDEWYSMTKEEVEYYESKEGPVARFPWQV